MPTKMPISHAIAHHVRRLDTTAEASLASRDTEMPLDGKVEELLRDLKRTFCNRAGKTYGLFSEDIGSFPFASLLANYRDEKIDFAGLTRDTLAHFKVELDKSEAVTDAHLLFWEERHGDVHHLYVCLIDHDEALYIDGELSVQTTSNIGSLLLAARVSLNDWRSGGSSYLAMLRERADQSLSEAFHHLLGFTDGQLDLVADTDEFLQVVDAYSDTLPEEKARDVRAQVVDYCIEQDKGGEAVEFTALSSTLDETSPDAFSSFVEAAYEEKGTAEPARRQLIPNRSRLKQYVRMAGRSNAMSISFNVDCLGDNIEYNHEQDELLIRGLPKSLRSRLLAYLRAEDAER
jgi:nucleoid-associated protein